MRAIIKYVSFYRFSINVERRCDRKNIIYLITSTRDGVVLDFDTSRAIIGSMKMLG